MSSAGSGRDRTPVVTVPQAGVQTFFVPTVNDELRDFDSLFALAGAVTAGVWSECRFDFSRCGFLRQNAVAFLGGLARFVELRGARVTIAVETIEASVRANLSRNGFLTARGLSDAPSSGHAVRYREDATKSNAQSILDYLKREWLCWLSLSDALRNMIAGHVWEMYENAFEHAQSRVGVISCGQHYPGMQVLKLTVIDFGVSIPTNVRGYLNMPRLDTGAALQWAFRRGTTTKPGPGGRGMGLDILKEFVRVNNGRLEVFSGDGYGLIDSGTESFTQRATGFTGTLLNISLNCDGTHYRLASELPNGLLF